MVYAFKKIIGPFIGAISISFGASVSTMYGILTILCLTGTFGFLLLKPMGIKDHESDEEEIANLLSDDNQDSIETEIVSEMSLSESMNKIFSLWKDMRLWYLVPFTIYTGTSSSFASGIYPLLIAEPKYKFYM